MELLVVIAIIAIVAALVVGLAGIASENKKVSRAKAELAKLVTLIDAYQSKVGVFPPDRSSSPGTNSLLYELAGGIRDRADDTNPNYITPFGNITSNELWTTYGTSGMLNAIEKDGNADDMKVHRILKDIHKDQTNAVAGHISLVVPVDGPNGQPNPWKYLRGANAVHNPDTYDLWVEIVVRGKTITIGNWSTK